MKEIRKYAVEVHESTYLLLHDLCETGKIEIPDFLRTLVNGYMKKTGLQENKNKVITKK